MRPRFGAIAQLGERLHGMQEVGGSIPPSSTKYGKAGHWAGFFVFRTSYGISLDIRPDIWITVGTVEVRDQVLRNCSRWSSATIRSISRHSAPLSSLNAAPKRSRPPGMGSET